MPWYSLNSVSIINHLRIEDSQRKVWFADDVATAGKIKTLYDRYCHLETHGLKYGYHVNGLKSWLIVKSPEIAEEATTIFGQNVNITADGKRHLGAVIGSEKYKKEYYEGVVDNWVEELCDIADTQPQAAFAAYTKGYKHKFNYFLRKIENFEQFVIPVDQLLNDKFIPTLFISDR